MKSYSFPILLIRWLLFSCILQTVYLGISIGESNATTSKLSKSVVPLSNKKLTQSTFKNTSKRTDYNNTNDTNNNNPFSPTGIGVIIPLTIIYVAIFLAGVMGNVSTCLVISRNKYMHTPTNYYLVSLAVSDLLVLLFGLPSEICSFYYADFTFVTGEAFCILRSMISESSSNASVLTITAFTVERYLAINMPMKRHRLTRLSRSIKVIILIWLLAIGFATTIALQMGVDYHQDLNGRPIKSSAQCTMKETPLTLPHPFLINFILFFAVPMVLITVLYVLIGIKLHKADLLKATPGGSKRISDPRPSSPASTTAYFDDFPSTFSNQNPKANSLLTTGTHKFPNSTPNSAKDKDKRGFLARLKLDSSSFFSSMESTFTSSLYGKDRHSSQNTNINNDLNGDHILVRTKSGRPLQIVRDFASSIGSWRTDLRKKRRSRHPQTQSRRAILKMLIAVVISFFLCYAPNQAQRLHYYYVKHWNERRMLEFRALFYISGILFYVSAAINPIIYNVISLKYRRAFKYTLAELAGSCYNSRCCFCFCTVCCPCLNDYFDRVVKERHHLYHSTLKDVSFVGGGVGSSFRPVGHVNKAVSHKNGIANSKLDGRSKELGSRRDKTLLHKFGKVNVESSWHSITGSPITTLPSIYHEKSNMLKRVRTVEEDDSPSPYPKVSLTPPSDDLERIGHTNTMINAHSLTPYSQHSTSSTRKHQPFKQDKGSIKFAAKSTEPYHTRGLQSQYLQITHYSPMPPIADASETSSTNHELKSNVETIV